MSIGDTLAEARRQTGLTVTQVSQQTRIRETIVRAIERGDFSMCGGDFYARGHIRSIAKVVGLDPEQVIAEFDATHGAPHAIRAAEVFEPSTPIRLKEGRRLNWSVAMVVALAAIIGFVIYHAVSSSGHPASPSASSQHIPAPVSHPTSHSPSPTASASTATYRRVLVVKLVVKSAQCWVEFTTLDGGYLTQDTLAPGQTKTWTFRRAVSMEIGNPGAVVLTVNGHGRGSPGPVGNPITLSFRPVKQLTS
ncbi:MAG: helix-turn-helix domain-containing protein [Streptosporangiaceae bacterium]